MHRSRVAGQSAAVAVARPQPPSARHIEGIDKDTRYHWVSFRRFYLSVMAALYLSADTM